MPLSGHTPLGDSKTDCHGCRVISAFVFVLVAILMLKVLGARRPNRSLPIRLGLSKGRVEASLCKVSSLYQRPGVRFEIANID